MRRAYAKKQDASEKKQGFSLIELAMIAVIIALLTAAVSTGKSLMEASRLRSLMGELSEINKSFLLFQEKYLELPGDMSDAWDYWGTDCMSTADLCNGDGNERIGDSLLPDNYETGMAWRHLQLAKLLGGPPMDGTASVVGGGFVSNVIGVNLPPSDAITGAGYYVETFAYYFTSGLLAGQPNILGTHIQLSGFPAVFPLSVLTPDQASVIDRKLDDGIPRVGKVKGVTTGVTTGDEDACSLPRGGFTDLREPVYQLGINKPNCSIYYRIDNSLKDTRHQ